MKEIGSYIGYAIFGLMIGNCYNSILKFLALDKKVREEVAESTRATQDRAIA
jgi:hypothetical protein